MFGFLRFYLAWMVVITHISTVLGHVGGFAVFSFYILSGYLMTLIMNDKYKYNMQGFKKYLLNRFLRIYPPYLFVAIITLIGIILFSEAFLSLHKTLRLPETLHEIVSNIIIFGLFPGIPEGGNLPMARLVPAAWALHVELCFYLLIGVILGRYKKLVVSWFIVSALYHAVAVTNDYPRYSPIYAASLPFSIGALIYHYRNQFIRILPTSNSLILVSLIIYSIYILIAGMIPVTTSVYPFYLNILLTSILICQLSSVDGRNNNKLKKIDSFLGGLSYPIYLSHWLVAVFVASIFDFNKSVTLFVVTIPFLLIFSIVMKYLIDDPIEVKRSSVAKSLRNS